MATHFEQRLRNEEQTEAATEPMGESTGPIGPATPQRMLVPSIPKRTARLVVAGLSVGLALTTVLRIATARARLHRSRQGRRGQGRGRGRALVTVQPRVAVFAPSITISLPFSGITGQVRPVRIPSGRSRRRSRGRGDRAGWFARARGAARAGDRALRQAVGR